MKYIYLLFIISFSYIDSTAQDILMQDGTFNQCSGFFYDSGGLGDGYSNGENFTLTICPDDPSLEIILEFNTFQLAVDGDEMSIYDADTADAAFLLGNFTDTLANNPELDLIAATNPSGCLTIVFDSTTFFTNSGWEASISCRLPCQTITPEVSDISPLCSGDNTLEQQFVEANQPITFSGNALTSSGNNDDLTYEWNFQGVILTGQNVNQTFTTPGVIDATLTVTDGFGCFGVSDFTVVVGNDLIIVDDTVPLNDLVSDILIQGDASSVNNINSPNNGQLNGENFQSYGYFQKGCSPFPFEEGIILATTDVNSVLNFNFSGGGFQWPGDPDLESLIQQPGNTNNATVIEFEFTPCASEIEFDYLFASYEYPVFVCDFADTFAFILSGPGISDINDYDHDGNPATPDLSLDLGGLNIALVPGTTTPVSPVNVHDETCGAGTLGEFAFPDSYDTANSEGNNPGDIDVTGRTVELTARATVIPGATYTIKLAIADRSDTQYDSFVFIEGGSFELSANIGDDLVLEDVTALCEGETQVLQVFDGVAPPGFDFQWTKDGVPIPGETAPTINVTETGEYCVELAAGTDCNSSDCILVDFIPVFNESEDISDDINLTTCEPFSGSVLFDLTQNNVPISTNISNEFFENFQDFQDENPGVEPYIVTYFETAVDASNVSNPIINPDSFSVDPSDLPFTVYYSVTDNFNLNCIDGNSSIGSFELNVSTSNIGTLQNLVSCSDTAGIDIATFDLNLNDSNVLNGQDSNNFDVIYYNSEQNAIDNVDPILNSDNFQNTTNPQTIWAKQDNLENVNCFSIASFQVEVFVTPAITQTPSLSACDDFSGNQVFDLTQNDAAALGIANAADAQLTYYTSQSDADAGINFIADPANYISSANSETIFVRAESVDSNECFSVDSFSLQIFDTEANPPQNISVCEPTGNTGQTTFNLTQQNAVIFGPNQDSTTHSISYHTSQADAQGGADPIDDPANYTNSNNPETLWARVQNLGDPSCFALTSFEVSITEEPEILNPPADLLECGDFTGSQTFDLSQYDAINLGILNPAETLITYHNTAANANTGDNPIADPANYVPANLQEDIFIRAVNINDDQCFVTTSFSIEVFNVEILPAGDLESCDDGNGTATSSFDLTSNNLPVLGSNQSITTHNVTYYENETDATAGTGAIDNPIAYDNISSPQTVWVRVENINNTDCFEVSSFELLVTDSAPINTDIDPLIACDDDNDGFFNNFDLNAVTSLISFDNPDVAVSYHLTPDDAQNSVGALSSPYANVVESLQTLYFRATDTNNGCEQFGDFELQVFDSPLLTPIEEPLIGCDDNNDDILFFDLTQIEAEVLGGLDPDPLVITYHTSLSDAQNGINEIIEPDAFQNTTNPQTIWIRVTDSNSPGGCFDIEAFDIIVEPTPDIVNPEPLEICDDEDSGDLSDEIATFDLNDKISEITQGNNELNVEFFVSQADLDNDNPISPIDAYVNIANPQTLEVRVTSGTNGCESFTTLTLVVNPVPSMAPELEPLEVCDPDNDGFAEFDLQATIVDILNNEPDVSISFHLTQADAELGVNPIDISNPFGTSNPGQQTIYVRAENTGPNGDDGTGCFDTRPLDLIVIPSPEIENLDDLSRCDDESPNGFASFDLTVNTNLAIGNQEPADLQVTYHETQSDAEQGINPIAIPTNYTNITNPQLIYVRIENTATGCVDLFDAAEDVNNTFTLTVEPLPVVNPPSVLEVCDDDNNQDPFPQTTFDLTVKQAEIIGQTIVPANLQFSYYESQDDVDNDNPIADPTAYANISQPQSIIVTVIDTATENNCFDSTVLTISVLPLPSPSETDPEVLRLQGCDDDNDGVANQAFDLTESGILIAGSETVELSYYLTESAADTQDPALLIGSPEAYVNQPSFNLTDDNGNPTNVQLIYVRVDNAVPGNFCYVIVPVELVTNSAPVLNPNGNPFAYTLCEDEDTNPGQATLFSLDDIANNLWDFTAGSSDVIIPLLDPDAIPAQSLDDVVVSYHFTEQDAEDGINAIAPGQPVSNGDILFIRLSNPETSCFNTGAIGQLQMVIEPRPAIAADNPDDIVVCAEDINSPAIGTVDLTQQDEAINPGAPDNTMVVYYAGMMNYNNATPVEDPGSITTTQSPQTIIAEVVNTVTLCESSNFVSFDIIVDPLPNVDISGFEGDIVCFDSGGNLINNEVSPPTIDTGLSEDLYDFVWTLNGGPFPGSSSSIEATSPGVYTVTVTDTQSGCVAGSSAEIIESTPPEFNVSVLTPSFSENHVVEVNTITGNGDFEFRLDDGPWVSLEPGQTTLIFSNIAPGLHVISGRDSGGCGEIEISFNVIDFPPFFTPNQDGINETWNITSLSDQPNAKIYIFDRYGKLLKQLNPAGEGWDGTFNGKNMPAQDYWFRVEFNEPQNNIKSTFKAHFTLKR